MRLSRFCNFDACKKVNFNYNWWHSFRHLREIVSLFKYRPNQPPSCQLQGISTFDPFDHSVSKRWPAFKPPPSPPFSKASPISNYVNSGSLNCLTPGCTSKRTYTYMCIMEQSFILLTKQTNKIRQPDRLLFCLAAIWQALTSQKYFFVG